MKMATLALAILFSLAGPIWAQDSENPGEVESSPEDPVWFLGQGEGVDNSGRSLKPFTTWDFGALYRLSGDTYGPRYPYADSPPKYFFSLDIARMSPRKSGVAHGFGLGFAAESDSWRVSMNYRLRKILGGGRYLEIAPGIILVDSASQSDVQWPGFTAQFGLGLSRYFGLVLRVDSRRKEGESYEWDDYSSYPETTDYQWTDTSWYGGLRMSSHVGMGATLAGGLVAGALALLASGL
jgi:hypothetical protein